MQNDFTSGTCSGLAATDMQKDAECKRKKDAAEDAKASADRKVLGGYIATGVGAAVLVAGLILVLTIDDTSRYESPHGSVAWLGWANADGGGVALAGRF